ncbi:MAG TPA: metallophosphoesterase family protein [Streptosporangiaceae bacterium]
MTENTPPAPAGTGPARRCLTVAVLADIHGNLPALEAVLAEPDVAAADAVVLLGDIALGPLPGPTLDRLAGLGERAVWVHGNCERELVTAFDGGPVPGPAEVVAAATATAELISAAHRDLLTGLPLTVTLDVAGLGAVLFCHASPRRDDEMVLVDSPPPRWAAALAGVTAPTVVCGHSHMQFDRLAAGHRVLNPGSVGMPYGQPGAPWALLGEQVTLRSTPYDTEAAAARIGAGGYRDAASWAREYVLTRYPADEALAAFTEIARQQAAAGG